MIMEIGFNHSVLLSLGMDFEVGPPTSKSILPLSNANHSVYSGAQINEAQALYVL